MFEKQNFTWAKALSSNSQKQFKLSMCWQHAKIISPNKNPPENDLIEIETGLMCPFLATIIRVQSIDTKLEAWHVCNLHTVKLTF